MHGQKNIKDNLCWVFNNIKSEFPVSCT